MTVPPPGWPRPPDRICVVMLSAIGDAVHVLPVVNALKAAWPSCRISWIIQPVPHQLVKDHPAVDEFLLFRRRRGLAGWQGYQELMADFPQRPWDLALNLQVYFKAGLITALMPARVKLGFDRARARDLNWLFTNEKIEASGQRHVQDQYFEFIEHLGIDPHPARWGIPITPAEREAQAAFFAHLERPVCSVVVGTSKPRKNWRPEGYARVLEAMESEFGLQPVLVGGPSAVERDIADRVLAETRARPLDMLGDDLRRLVWLLDGSALVLSPDTGPLHVARALEVPVVGLYGYTNPKRTGPYRLYQDLVVDGYAAFPGEAYPVSQEYRDGMKRVSVDMVLEKVALAMERYVGKG
ncbi:MAG: glycosyltransferase family 9 protein [Gemmatimonadetes bacterium]|nr:glycosyltransferase family 9 protein [Gemmatimonadota bacterium]